MLTTQDLKEFQIEHYAERLKACLPHQIKFIENTLQNLLKND